MQLGRNDARSDGEWLALAANIAARARPLSRPNPAVGAVVVKNGRIVGRGWTAPGGRPHAEQMALEMAGSEAKGADIFVTLEPCAHKSPRGPSCAQTIISAGIKRCIFGVIDPDPRTAGKGQALMQEAGLDARHQLCEASQASLAGYLSQRQSHRPFITLKLAMSLDGAIATPFGQSQWITGSKARQHVHAQRARQDAILVGGRTWRADQPRLDVRIAGLEDRSPERIVLTRGEDVEGVRTISSVEAVTGGLPHLQYLYVEGGAQTAASFIRQDLVDQLHIYRAPIIMGEGLTSIADIELFDLSDAHGRWGLSERRQLGPDVFEAYTRIHKGD